MEGKKMNRICPNCETKTQLEKVTKEELINVRGEEIKVDSEYFTCTSCENDFEDMLTDYDPLKFAYSEYRKRHGWTQPDEIREFRRKHGLTQGELSKLLGWGGATLSRYENGALQDETHEKALKMAMDPRILYKLINESPNALPKEKACLLKEHLEKMEEDELTFERIYEIKFGRYEPDESSGYQKLNLAKLFNAIIYLCVGGVLKTKLNKLLFYSDFLFYKKNTISITGARYARITFGPVLDNYDHYFATIVDEKLLEVDEVIFGDYWGEEYRALVGPDVALFSRSELETLDFVKNYFMKFTAGEIRDFSHKEKGYQDTSNGDLISYKYASYLNI